MTGRDMMCQLLKTKYKYVHIPHTLDHVLEIIAENMDVLDVWKDEQHIAELKDEIKRFERALKRVKSPLTHSCSWVSVKDRLPDKLFKSVLTITSDGVVLINWLEETGETEGEGYFAYSSERVTHWMPIPEPPESEEE